MSHVAYLHFLEHNRRNINNIRLIAESKDRVVERTAGMNEAKSSMLESRSVRPSIQLADPRLQKRNASQTFENFTYFNGIFNHLFDEDSMEKMSATIES